METSSDTGVKALPSVSQHFQMAQWRVDGETSTLTSDAQVKTLRPKVMQVLCYLLQHAPRTVTREELAEVIWQGNFAVADQAITNAIWTIRQAIEDRADAPQFIQTIPKKGFRLIAPVQVLDAVSGAETESKFDGAARARGLPKTKLRVVVVGAFSVIFLVLLTTLLIWHSTTSENTSETNKSLSWLPEHMVTLTDYSGMEYLGAVSPDGQMLAFAWWQGSGLGRLYLRMAADSTRTPYPISPVEGDVVSVSWSPDSLRLAYAVLVSDNQCEVWVYTLSTAQSNRVTDCFPLRISHIAWSPSGPEIAVARRTETMGQGLHLVNVDTGKTDVLTRTDGMGIPDFLPTWSKDGKSLFFVREAVDGSKDLFQLDNQGNTRRLTEKRFIGLHGLAWSESDQALIYSTSHQGSRMLWSFDLINGIHQSLGIEGSVPMIEKDQLVFSVLKRQQSIGRVQLGPEENIQSVLSSIGNELSPDYSPNRDQLAFVSTRSGRSELWIARGDGTEARPLKPIRGDIRRPRWSDDGKQLAFVGHCKGESVFGVCVLQVDNGHLRTLYQQGSLFGTPTWAPDGRTLYVAVWHETEPHLLKIDVHTGDASPVDNIRDPRSMQRRLQGSMLYFADGKDDRLQILNMNTGKVSYTAPVPNVSKVISWMPVERGILLLYRDQEEHFALMNEVDGSLQPLASFALRTFTELPRISLTNEAHQIYIELSDSASADLMRVSRVGSRTFPASN